MTPPVDPSLAIAGGPDTHVTALLPATAPPPEPARKINFFKALLLYWLLPKRYGPHLAVGSWKRALLAQVLSVLVFLTALLPALPGRISFFSLDDWREMAAAKVIDMATETAMGKMSWISVLLVLLSIPLAELALVLLSILIMPWYAGGDRAGSVFKRSLKSVYWSTTILIPLTPPAWLFTAYRVNPYQWVDKHGEPLAVGVLLLVVGLPAVLFMRMLLAGGTRYVGAPEGPAFAPREPRCDDCGYLIIGLPLEARCPECGLEVRESLSGDRRRPTVWQENEFKPTGFADLLRLQWVVLTRKDFFKRLPVQSGLASARHFWWGTWCLMVLATLLALRLLAVFVEKEDDFIGMLMTGALAVLILPLLLQALMMFTMCLHGQLCHGLRDYRGSAVVCYYASPLMWPGPLLLVLALAPMALPVERLLHEIAVPSPLGGWLDGMSLYMVGVLLAFLISLLWWALRLNRALRDIRHANV